MNVFGGELVTINGSNLPTNLQSVLIGKQTVKVLSSSNTQITINTPQMDPGFYDLAILSGSIGYAK